MVAAAAAALFVGLRWSLLHGEGVLEGANVDTSILALMGKKMAEGRGLDVFAWGTRHMGPLTSMIAAAWTWPLLALNAPWPWALAVRLAAMTEVALGIALIAWAVARVDRRAAAVTALVLAAGPPEVFRMSVDPLGHEMAFLISAAIIAIVVRLLTAPSASIWWALALGVLAGIGWWMNRTVVYAIAGALMIGTLRSDLFARLRPPPDPRPLPGLVEAAAFLLRWSGIALLALYVILGFTGASTLPFVFGPALDGILLVAAAQLLVLVVRPPRLSLHLTPESRAELRFLACCAAGFFAGYAPALLAKVFDWYPNAYEVGFALRTPDDLARELATHVPYAVPSFFGVSTTPAGVLWSIALVPLLTTLLVRFFLKPSREWGVRAFFASIIAATVAAMLLVNGTVRARYWMAAVGPLFALLALEGFRWWDSRRIAARACAALALGACLIAFITSAILSRTPSRNPDLMVTIRRVEALDCRVTYVVAGHHAFDFRLFTGERRGFIPYGSYDYTPEDTAAYRAQPGRRCFATADGDVFPLPGDLQLKGRGRSLPARQNLE